LLYFATNRVQYFPWLGGVPPSRFIWLGKHFDALGWQAADATVYLCGNPSMIQNAGVKQAYR
jgi:hypothetical protein